MASKQPKKTGWFDADTKPVREGQYEVKSGRATVMALFEEDRWWKVEDDGSRGGELDSVKQWRGLAEEPKIPYPEEKKEEERAEHKEDQEPGPGGESIEPELEESEEDIGDEDRGVPGLPA